ncbi:hypothetical protein PM082_008628 [Marasmius tenuissimus]|nr:hypothetical protein PM082_008628 [Marasmius tenuissimus]
MRHLAKPHSHGWLNYRSVLRLLHSTLVPFNAIDLRHLRDPAPSQRTFPWLPCIMSYLQQSTVVLRLLPLKNRRRHPPRSDPKWPDLSFRVATVNLGQKFCKPSRGSSIYSLLTAPKLIRSENSTWSHSIHSQTLASCLFSDVSATEVLRWGRTRFRRPTHRFTRLGSSSSVPDARTPQGSASSLGLEIRR